MQQFERLRAARIEAGYKTGTDAAKAIGVPVATYNMHENGHRRLTVNSAERYAKAFDVRTSWLLTGEEPKHYTLTPDVADSIPEKEWGKYIPGKRYRGNAENSVPEIDAFGQEAADSGSFDATSTWSFPTDFIVNDLKLKPESVFLLAAPDDAMAGSIAEGDRAIVDGAQRAFRGDGIYVIQDVDGHLHLRDLTKVIVRRQPDEEIGVSTYKPPQTYFAKMAEINVIGKVVGKIGRL